MSLFNSLVVVTLFGLFALLIGMVIEYDRTLFEAIERLNLFRLWQLLLWACHHFCFDNYIV
jgi:hypothetical protein